MQSSPARKGSYYLGEFKFPLQPSTGLLVDVDEMNDGDTLVWEDSKGRFENKPITGPGSQIYVDPTTMQGLGTALSPYGILEIDPIPNGPKYGPKVDVDSFGRAIYNDSYTSETDVNVFSVGNSADDIGLVGCYVLNPQPDWPILNPTVNEFLGGDSYLQPMQTTIQVTGMYDISLHVLWENVDSPNTDWSIFILGELGTWSGYIAADAYRRTSGAYTDSLNQTVSRTIWLTSGNIIKCFVRQHNQINPEPRSFDFQFTLSLSHQ